MRRRTACTILSLGVRVDWVRYECINLTVLEIDVDFFLVNNFETNIAFKRRSDIESVAAPVIPIFAL